MAPSSGYYPPDFPAFFRIKTKNSFDRILRLPRIAQAFITFPPWYDPFGAFSESQVEVSCDSKKQMPAPPGKTSVPNFIKTTDCSRGIHAILPFYIRPFTDLCFHSRCLCRPFTGLTIKSSCSALHSSSHLFLFSSVVIILLHGHLVNVLFFLVRVQETLPFCPLRIKPSLCFSSL